MKGRISEILLKRERIAVLEKRIIFSEREGERERDDGGLSARRRGERKKKWEAISVVSLFRGGTRPG